jgi:hypothetical protein
MVYQSQTGVRLRTRVQPGAAQNDEVVAPIDAEISKTLAQPESKEYADLRDRAAYVMITGTFPTHLRPHMTGLLRKMSHYSLTPAALDGKSGSLGLDATFVDALKLAQHPMVAKAQALIAEGYLIQASRDVKARRPFSRVFLYRTDDTGNPQQITVHLNGATLDGWNHQA